MFVFVFRLSDIVELADFLSFVGSLEVEGAAGGLRDAGRAAGDDAPGDKFSNDVIEKAGGVDKAAVGIGREAVVRGVGWV